MRAEGVKNIVESSGACFLGCSPALFFVFAITAEVIFSWIVSGTLTDARFLWSFFGSFATAFVPWVQFCIYLWARNNSPGEPTIFYGAGMLRHSRFD